MADADLVPVPNEPPTRIIVQPSNAAGWEERQAVLKHVQHLAWVLDNAFVIPGTNFRFGLDPLLGLIPIVGDFIGLLISGYIIFLASRLQVPRVVLWHMMVNSAVDSIVGSLPIIGDALDVVWKSNAMNANLLEKALNDPKAAGRSSFWKLVGMSVLLIALLVGVVLLFVWAIRAITS
jgi:hypothetical protein